MFISVIPTFAATSTNFGNASGAETARDAPNNRRQIQTVACSRALTSRQRAVIDRPYRFGFAFVGALYEPPRFLFCGSIRTQPSSLLQPFLEVTHEPLIFRFVLVEHNRALCGVQCFCHFSHFEIS